MIPTMYLRFVKRRVGQNVVRILQQLWQERENEGSLPDQIQKKEWRDVELALDE